MELDFDSNTKINKIYLEIFIRCINYINTNLFNDSNPDIIDNIIKYYFTGIINSTNNINSTTYYDKIQINNILNEYLKKVFTYDATYIFDQKNYITLTEQQNIDINKNIKEIKDYLFSQSVQPPSVQPLSVQPPSVQPPSVQPLSVQPPSVQPPPVQPPPVQPPSVQPPPVQPPPVQPPSVQPPPVQPPPVQPPPVQPPSVQPPPVQPPPVQSIHVNLVSGERRIVGRPLGERRMAIYRPSSESVQAPSVQASSVQASSVQAPSVQAPSVQPNHNYSNYNQKYN